MQSLESQSFELRPHTLNSISEPLINNYPAIESSPFQSLDQALSSIFPTSEKEEQTSKAKGILGNIASTYTDEQLKGILSDFDYLADTWLDLFEKKIFEGKTLEEMLKMT